MKRLQAECRNSLFTRRAFLQAGMAGGVSIPLFNPCFLQAESERSSKAYRQRIRSCIVLFYYGGPSHLDTFDLKPHAPREIRGEFQPIATSAPGVQISEHLPHTARVMHHAAVIRSMHHTNRLHDSASTETLTGRQSPQGDREEFSRIPQFFPCHGATLSFMWRNRQLDVTHAALPWVFHNVIDVPCQGGGFLGKAYDPFRITGDPAKLSYRAEMLATPDGLSSLRRADRQSLLESLDSGRLFTASDKVRQLQSLYERAYKLLDSRKIAQALDIEQEDPKTRECYGKGENVSRGGGNGAEKAYGRNLRGQNFLMARRLVEAGVPFVNVYDFKQQGQNWDSHADNFNQHKDHLLPPIDRAYAALLEDLEERGLLESTLVVAMGEFGRTPVINGNAGRDHWPDCYSLLLAGGGVRGGSLYGASDKTGAYPDVNPVTPADLAATIFWCFGLDPRAEVHDRTNRPYRLAEGHPLRELFV